MHNTSTKYKQMHNKNNIMKWQLNTYLYLFRGASFLIQMLISWNDNWILIYICFMGRLLLEHSTSSYSSFMSSSFLIQMLNMDKRFLKSWVLCIPYCLRDLLWMLRAWSSHLLFSYYELSIFLCGLFLESVESNHFLLEHISHMNEFHDPGRPFNMAITTSSFSISSSTTSSCYAF